MAIIFFDQSGIRINLLPLTYTRPISEIRVGIFTISEKWKQYFQGETGWLTENYLRNKYPSIPGKENIYLNGAVCPDYALANAIETLPQDAALVKGELLIAYKAASSGDNKQLSAKDFAKATPYEKPFTLIDKPWKIYHETRNQLIADFEFIKKGESKPLNDPHTICYATENIFIEEGVRVKAAVLNAENGPIYLGKNSEIKEGALIRGPFSLGEGSVVNMGAKVRGDTSVGPYCKVGGEISNSVLFGYSNKSHDGFLGNSVVGEWCNIGADTNTSNLKNNYKKVKLWDYNTEKMETTELQFCGLIMGDHAKCSINTMFNTGTIAGVGANIFGEGFLPNFIPSFSWGGSREIETFDFDKFLEMTEVVLQRRNKELSQDDIHILKSVYNLSAKYRTWEK